MPAAMKDRMVDGAEVHEQIRTFNNENKDIGIARTPKRHHPGEQRSIEDKHCEEQNDVICMNDKTNDQLQKQPHQQYMQKRKTTNCLRTFYNGEMTAMNRHRLRNTEKERTVKQIDQQAYLINHEHEQKTSIPNHALNCAVEQHLSPINIKCDLKFIDRDENLQYFTHNVELFVFLCNPQNYPEKLLNTAIHPNPPKRLPPQRSAILKYVLKDTHIDDIKKEISSKYKSLFNIEEMRGTIVAKNRHIRIELSEHNEYINILNTGTIAFEGQLIEVSAFLAPPRLLICSRYNTPGHLKKECKNDVDLCRRCGSNRNEGEHRE
ncbi:unnamed protein product [Rotaria socialis]|uniref:Uncharacterized protein n=1 Tax=Rotaria socialis TaxID=392032 RepID=A0A821PZE9_9BILA|nr:unnamed protein product [Rotaria socialis]